QRMMDEHIRVGHEWPDVKLNTTYSYGLDDQEFVVAFETDHVGRFLDLLMALRHTEASMYTVRDTPSFTCLARSIGECLEAGGWARAPRRGAERSGRFALEGRRAGAGSAR